MFAHLSSSPRSLPLVQRVRARKTAQRRITKFEKKKTALFRSREQATAAKFAELTIARQLKRSRSWNSEERSMPVRPRFPVFIAASGLVCHWHL